MLCTECDHRTNEWKLMKLHYRVKHPEIKRPDKLFTRAARENVIGEPCGCNK